MEGEAEGEWWGRGRWSHGGEFESTGGHLRALLLVVRDHMGFAVSTQTGIDTSLQKNACRYLYFPFRSEGGGRFSPGNIG